MTKNVGKTDKVIRIVLAVALFSLFIFLDGSAKWWGLLGFVPLATGLMGSCPLYSVFKISTKGK
ncbi:MAG: DUF2892 domain-containing protein [Eubacteriales bacterium]